MNHELSVTSKVGDPADEPRRRARALVALRDAIADEARVRDEAARATASRAESAVWLGASLADLASVTGHSRQAARKRWPDLGAVTRRRRWLSHHVDDVLWAARLVADHAAELPPGSTAGLADGIAAVSAAFAEEPHDDDADPVGRWHLLEALVDQRLRLVAGSPVGSGATGQARFARDGAFAVVAYYDHARADDAAGVEDGDG